MTGPLPDDLFTLILDGSRLAVFMAGVLLTIRLVHWAHTSAVDTFRATAEYEAATHKTTKAELREARAEAAHLREQLNHRDAELAAATLRIGLAAVDRAALASRLEYANRLLTDAGVTVNIIDQPPSAIHELNNNEGVDEP